jgi:hypothetical protein
LFQGVGDVSGVYYEASGGQADCRAGVAGWGGYVGACGGRDSEGGEVRGHVWIFDPVGFVGDFLEVEGEAGCGLGRVSLAVRPKSGLFAWFTHSSMDSATNRHNGPCWGGRKG